MKRLALIAMLLGACSVEKLAPLRMSHRGALSPPRRVVVLPAECTPSSTVKMGDDPTAWCNGIQAMVASELAFRGAEVVDISTIPVEERQREEVENTLELNGSTQSDSRRVKITGAMFSEADAWLQRDAIDKLGVDTLVRTRVAQTSTWPVRTLALIRLTRPSDAALINASVCELETSRLDTDQETAERAIRCALENLK